MNWRRLCNPPFILCITLLFGVGIALIVSVKVLGYHLSKRPIEAPQKVASLPAVAGPWQQQGRDVAYAQEMISELGTQNYMDRYYLKPGESGRPPTLLQLHCAYYTGTIDTVPHVPERCMVGGGWSIVSVPGKTPVRLDASSWMEDEEATTDVRRSIDEHATIYTMRLGPNSKAPGNRVRLPRDAKNIQMYITEFQKPGTSHKLFAGYFFLANGGVASRAEDVRLLAFDKRSDYAYYLKVQTSSDQVTSAQELADQTADLLNNIVPDLMLCIPDWIEVQRGDYPPDNPRRKSLVASATASASSSSPASKPN